MNLLLETHRAIAPIIVEHGIESIFKISSEPVEIRFAIAGCEMEKPTFIRLHCLWYDGEIHVEDELGALIFYNYDGKLSPELSFIPRLWERVLNIQSQLYKIPEEEWKNLVTLGVTLFYEARIIGVSLEALAMGEYLSLII